MNEIRLIRLAIALGQHRNFARAAESLNLTQPSLTRGIAELERSLRVQLFDRTRKGVVPTAFGRVLLERGTAVLRSEATLRREIQLLAGLESGTLSVSAGPLPTEISVATAVARVSQAHPGLKVQFRRRDPEQVVLDVLEERVDVGVAQLSEPDPSGRFIVERLAPQRVYLACRPGHPLTQEHQPSFSRALDFPLAINVLRGAPAAAVSARDGSRVESDERTREYAPQIVVDSVPASRYIARATDALCAGTSGMLHDDVVLGHLVMLNIDAPVLRTVHSIFHLRDRTLAPAARVFIDNLRAVEAELLQADSRVASRKAPATRRPRPARPRRKTA